MAGRTKSKLQDKRTTLVICFAMNHQDLALPTLYLFTNTGELVEKLAGVDYVLVDKRQCGLVFQGRHLRKMNYNVHMH